MPRRLDLTSALDVAELFVDLPGQDLKAYLSRTSVEAKARYERLPDDGPATPSLSAYAIEFIEGRHRRAGAQGLEGEGEPGGGGVQAAQVVPEA